MSDSIRSPKLEALSDVHSRAMWELGGTLNKAHHVVWHHDDDEEAWSAVCDEMDEANWQLVYSSTLLEAQQRREGVGSWTDSLEARAYLEALKTIVEHLEQATAVGDAA